MRVLKFAALFLLIFGFSSVIYFQVNAQEEEGKNAFSEEEEADLPPGANISKEEYLRLRNEHLDVLRGFDTATQQSRTRAVRKLEQSENELAARRESLNLPLVSQWQPLGPAPIPVGTSSNSGRTSAIAVHPTNPNIVYVGAAQGGLYRTLNGGATWTPLLDSALTLAIGAVTISPSDPTTVFVGTGEATLCGSGCFIGVGIYRITNADTNPVLSPALNRDAGGNDVFTGRAIGRIVAHPTDPNILFVTSTRGIAGIGSTTSGLVLPDAGVYRTTNALSANPTFEKLTIQGTGGASRSAVDAVIEPGNAARLIVTVVGESGDGGIYLSTNALDAAPTFARVLTTGDGSSLGRTELAINKVGGVTTVYAAT